MLARVLDGRVNRYNKLKSDKFYLKNRIQYSYPPIENQSGISKFKTIEGPPSVSKTQIKNNYSQYALSTPTTGRQTTTNTSYGPTGVTQTSTVYFGTAGSTVPTTILIDNLEPTNFILKLSSCSGNVIEIFDNGVEIGVTKDICIQNSTISVENQVQPAILSPTNLVDDTVKKLDNSNLSAVKRGSMIELLSKSQAHNEKRIASANESKFIEASDFKVTKKPMANNVKIPDMSGEHGSCNRDHEKCSTTADNKLLKASDLHLESTNYVNEKRYDNLKTFGKSPGNTLNIFDKVRVDKSNDFKEKNSSYIYDVSGYVPQFATTLQPGNHVITFTVKDCPSGSGTLLVVLASLTSFCAAKNQNNNYKGPILYISSSSQNLLMGIALCKVSGLTPADINIFNFDYANELAFACSGPFSATFVGSYWKNTYAGACLALYTGNAAPGGSINVPVNRDDCSLVQLPIMCQKS